MIACPQHDELLNLVAGSDEGQGALRSHVDVCPNCKRAMARYLGVFRLAAQYAAFTDPDPSRFANQVVSRRIDDLAQAALDGDSDAWESLFNQFNSRLWGYFRHKGAGETESIELAQRTWLWFFKARDQFASAGHFLPLFFTLISKVWSEASRDQGRRETVEPSTQSTHPAEPLDDAAIWELLTQQLETITDKERQLIHLRFCENMSFVELGQRIGLSEQEARGDCYRLVNRLARQINLH